jgi:hypothetical protein
MKQDAGNRKARTETRPTHGTERTLSCTVVGGLCSQEPIALAALTTVASGIRNERIVYRQRTFCF